MANLRQHCTQWNNSPLLLKTFNSNNQNPQLVSSLGNFCNLQRRTVNKLYKVGYWHSKCKTLRRQSDYGVNREADM